MTGIIGTIHKREIFATYALNAHPQVVVILRVIGP
jgi:hypothetical protein